MTEATAHIFPVTASAEPAGLRPVQMAWLVAAVFVVSAGYGGLLALLPGWLTPMMPGALATEVGRHVGFLSGVYAAVLVGAPLWGVVADRAGRGRILIVGLVGYVVSLLLLLVPELGGMWGLYALRGTTGFFVAAVDGAVSSTLSARIVLVLSALLGRVMMLGLARTLPSSRAPDAAAQNNPVIAAQDRPIALWVLIGALMFVLTGFELGIVLQGQQQPANRRGRRR